MESTDDIEVTMVTSCESERHRSLRNLDEQDYQLIMSPHGWQNSQLAVVQELKQKYGKGKITEEIWPRCGRQFECYSHGVFQSGEGGALQVYSDNSVFCNSCLLEDF